MIFKPKTIYLFFIFFTVIINNSFKANNNYNFFPPDSIIVDTNKKWFDKSDYLIVGTGVDYRDYKINFKNNTANLLGGLEVFYNDLALNYRHITEWKFYPIINQTNASIFTTTKYGSVGFSKAINPTSNDNFSKMTSFNFSTSYKKFDFDFSYLKFIGLNRVEPLYNTTSFLNNMSFSPINLNILYCVYGRIKTSLLYPPKKRSGTGFISIGVSQINIKNNGEDFIPALRLKHNKVTDTIDVINNIYLYKFVSSGVLLGFKYDFVFPIIATKNNIKPKVLYIKGTVGYGYNYQNYNYYTIADTINTVQHRLSHKGFGYVTNLNAKGSLICDVNTFIIGVGANYNSQNYGHLNGAILNVINNHVEDIRIQYNVFVSYRINCKKTYTKIDKYKQKLFGI